LEIFVSDSLPESPAIISRHRERVMETWIDALEWGGAVQTIISWAQRRESRIVSVCNVHSVVTARTEKALQDAINASDMATPDGMPVAWFIGRRLGRDQQRISGMELTLALCAEAERQGVTIAFYGSQQATLDRLRQALEHSFPRLHIGVMISPPFRPLTPMETAADLALINASGAGLLFVGLGCPKQEIWMHAHRNEILGAQVGIGAAFDFIAGTVKRPPAWMRESGLEWLGRLIAEPRRLWRRYFVTNSLFVIWLARELLSGGLKSRNSADLG